MTLPDAYFINVLSAQQSLATAETALAASDATLLDKQVSLFLSLGGGWANGDDRQASLSQIEETRKNSQ
jgi:outer membrane protein TolC